MAFDNPETLTLMGAWPLDRPGAVVTTVIVPNCTTVMLAGEEEGMRHPW